MRYRVTSGRFLSKAVFILLRATIVFISALAYLHDEKHFSNVICARVVADKDGIVPNTNSDGTSLLCLFISLIVLIKVLNFEFSSNFELSSSCG